MNFDEGVVDVQNYWNAMEEKLLHVVDLVAPVVEFTSNKISALGTIWLN